ncbi:MAG: hypothetical protein FWG68_03550, partial [Defluviitaleaceae bacterium]|nr:hypothetical protein [Defluviitaleaceae bacterium]
MTDLTIKTTTIATATQSRMINANNGEPAINVQEILQPQERITPFIANTAQIRADTESQFASWQQDTAAIALAQKVQAAEQRLIETGGFGVSGTISVFGSNLIFSSVESFIDAVQATGGTNLGFNRALTWNNEADRRKTMSEMADFFDQEISRINTDFAHLSDELR